MNINFEEALKALPKRAIDSHKGDYGHVCIIGGGQPGYAGAVCLAGAAALRAGAGLVSAVVHPKSLVLMNRAPAELMCHAPESAQELAVLLDKATVIVLGPGLSASVKNMSWAFEQFQAVMNTPRPSILDADALNILAQNPIKRENWILTPHPGEAARLLGVTIADIQKDREAAAKRLQEKFGGVIVLKGAGTLVSIHNEPVMQCAAGNPGMASGGMGDLLAGLIGGLVAQGLSLEAAAKLGVIVHSLAADKQKALGERGMLASDVLADIRALLNG